jgi:lipoprotein-anchoring transpeptidase ErfK/SrfK
MIMNTSVAVAAANTPTPGGLYYTTELIAPPDPNGPYGPYAYGLSGFSNVYQSFAGGPGQLGLHGTNQAWSIGQSVSHGCIRLRNQDITRLAKLLPLGVPVLVYR